MSLRNRLVESIAALDRLTAVDEDTIEPVPEPYHDDEKYIYPGAASFHASARLRVEEVHNLSRRRSEPHLVRQSLLANNEKAPSIHRSIMSSPRDEAADDFEPKLTLRYVVDIAINVLTVAFAFLCPAIGITIIGLAADNINWGTGRGSQEANTVDAWILRPWNSTNVHIWTTKMFYMPQYYDTQTFSALIVAGAIAALGGFIVGPLSVINFRSKGQSVKLTRNKNVRDLQHSPIPNDEL